ncbi:MAG: M1 family aminopeptidase [Planctomycetota bacterium]
MTAFRLLAAALAAAISASALAFDLAGEHEHVCRYCETCGQSHFRPDGSRELVGRKYAPDRLVDVERIKIDVTPNFAEQTIEAETTLTFSPISRPVREVTLDAVLLRVESVTSDPPLADYSSNDHTLTLLFESPLEPGQTATVTVKYSAQPKQGLYFRTEAMGYPAGEDHIWTQGQTYEARHWYPCFDSPNERSSTEVICRVPADMTVLSNGREVSNAVDADTGLRAVHWVQEKPHPNYLVCLVAGHFAKLEKNVGDLKLRFFTQPSLAEHAANSFADTDEIIRFFQDETGMPFPWDKYDQVTIRDFTSGGMENTTLTTLTHGTVFSNETENIYSSRGLDAHETAHQWFGDYVTCEDWSNLWLNEGFATYYTHLYKGHRLGRDEMLYGLYRDAQGRILPNADDTKPIVYRDYKNSWEQFDYRAYPKGSWVLHMLRNRLGKDVYRAGIKNYLERHALTSVATPELLAELEAASGLELDRFFDQYVYHGGAPVLKISHKWLAKEKLLHVQVEQTQKVSDDILLFHLPATFRFHLKDGVVDKPAEIDGAEHDFYFALPSEPEVVRFDPELTLLAKVEYSKPQPMLEAQLKLEGDVIGRIMAAEALGKRDNKKAVAALAAALEGDEFYGVRIAASKALAKLHTDEAYAVLAEQTDQDDARVRQQVVRDFGKFYRPETLEKLLKIASSEKNPAIAATAISGLSSFGGPKATRTIAEAMKADSLKDEQAQAALRTAAKMQDKRLKQQAIKTLRKRGAEFGARTYGRLLAVVPDLWGDAKDKTAAFDFLREQLAHPAVRVREGAVKALGDLGDRRAIPLLDSYADSGAARLKPSAEDALKKLEETAVSPPAEVRELRTMIREMQKRQEKLAKQLEEMASKAAAESTETD